MIVHPLALAVMILDGGAMLLAAFTAVTGSRVLSSWRSAAADTTQLRLERRYEGASMAGRGARFLFVFASLIYVTGIASWLPGLVPGAMCGTGVIQAMGQYGERSVFLRIVALLLLHLLAVGFEMDRGDKTGILAETNAKLALVAFPLVLLGVLDTARALISLNTTVPVSCCTALLDTVRNGENGLFDRLPDEALTIISVVAGLAVFILAILMRLERAEFRGWTWLLSVSAGGFLFFGAVGLVTIAVVLLLTIEQAINEIFRCQRRRPMWQRLLGALLLLSLGPFAAGLSIYLTGRLLIIPGLFGAVKPLLVSILVLFVFYCMIPNTKVQLKHAFVAALITGILLEALKLGFAFYVTHLGSTLSYLYGTFAIVPLAMVWIYLTWLIFLFGAEFAAALHEVQAHDRFERHSKG